jgi:hypothetical protein
MDNDLGDQVYNSLNMKETDELIDIWQTNDRVEWSDLAFDAIREILRKRINELPPQDQPIFKYDDEPENSSEEALPDNETQISIFKEQKDVDGLVKILENETDWLICLKAAEALAELGNESGMDYLIDALEIQDEDVKETARNMLEGLNLPRAKQALDAHPVAVTQPDSTSDTLKARYPFLTAWVGFITISALASLIVGLFPVPSWLRIVIDLIVGFYIFKFVVENNVLPYAHRKDKA